jgi:hypothetical protein
VRFPIFASPAIPQSRSVRENSTLTIHLNRFSERATAGLVSSALVSPSVVFTLCLALTCSSAAFSQDQVGIETKAAAPIAYVYVQVTKGVNVYSETAAGKLTLVNGSPFTISGQMEGITGSHLLSVGTTLLHSYKIASNGAIGEQVASINTTAYDSEDCGPTTGNKASLDHTGKYFYVQLSGGPGGTGCGWNDWQSYQIGTNGDFTFLDNDYSNFGENIGTTALTLDSSDMYGYAFSQEIGGFSDFSAFTRLSNGSLSYNSNFGEHDPTSDPNLDYSLLPTMATEDPHEHLAVVMTQCLNASPEACDPTGAKPQLASYTISTSTGSISSSNTEDNLPYVSTGVAVLDMSYDGKFVALAGSGVEIFNFNGAAVPTRLAPLKLSGIPFDQLTWDRANHLFALSYEKAKLYIFNVSKTEGVDEIGAPISVPGAYGLTGIIVVPK